MVRQNINAQRRMEYGEPNVRRNLYLVDYERQRESRARDNREVTYAGIDGRRRQPVRREDTSEGRTERSGNRGMVSARPAQGQTRQSRSSRTNQAFGYPSRSRQGLSRHTKEQRRKRVLLQRATVLLWGLCILVLGATLILRNGKASAAGNEENGAANAMKKEIGGASQYSGILVQGLPAEEFAKHPDWKEDFLTPNEYSRPGEPLESITNIFVHYTANPGTSAAQNRSYFEQQKDTHETSVSSHFIIGYEGEIIQCVPLDEIAYAVMSRNYDSVSIECCYLAEDGSFTQETYDSLISLLAWLTDVYDLDSSDILRHYDCGGKLCPLYYANHEEEWEQLKKDVDKQ